MTDFLSVFRKIPKVARFLAFLALSSVLLASCKTELYSNLEEQEANEMLAILLEENIPATKQLEKGNVVTLQVEKKDIARAVQLLTAMGLPRQDFATLGEVFKKDGFVSTPMEEHVRYIFGLSQEISRTLSDVDGVVSARVQIVLPDNDPGAEKVRPSSAAIFVKYLPEYDIAAMTSRIKRFVTNSIEGLSYDKVSIFLFPSRSINQWLEKPAPPSALEFSWFSPPVLVGMGGGAVGMLLLFALTGGVFWLLRRRRSKKTRASSGAIAGTSARQVQPRGSA